MDDDPANVPDLSGGSRWTTEGIQLLPWGVWQLATQKHSTNI